MTKLRRLWLRWKTRGFHPVYHDGCTSFMGPCSLCRDWYLARGAEFPNAKVHE